MRPEFLARYADQRLPRYTSYPTAPNFGAEVTAADYGAWLRETARDRSASLYLHIPFCRAMCWYCGCHTTVARRDGPVAQYLAALRREIALVAKGFRHRPHAVHIHFGGGTPTMLAPRDLTGLVALLRENFPVWEEAEVAIEIDPRTLTEAMIDALGAGGFTRASLGIQSFDPTVQGAINRVQSFEQTAAAVPGLRAAGIRGINFDLIYGLPHQTVGSCIDTVAQCLALRPERLSVFGYAHVPSFKKHQRRIDETVLPDAALRHAQAEAIAAAIVAAGYRRIGLDHYALPADSLARAQESGALRRNFQGYTTDPADLLIGLGASAISQLPQGFAQNEVVLSAYAQRVRDGGLATHKGYRLSGDDRLRGALIERLMCDFRVDIGEVCRRHGEGADAILSDAGPALERLAADGLIRLDGATVEIQPAARALVRTVAATFDVYLGRTGRMHSKAV